MSKKKKLITLFLLILFFLNGSFLAFYFLIWSPSEAAVELTESVVEEVVDNPVNESGMSDEYYSIHFSYNDAVDLCSKEAISRNSNLIQMFVNELSSRFNSTTNMYLITLDSHVGTPALYEEKTHTCDIDPKTQGVAFYKEITRKTVVRPQ